MLLLHRICFKSGGLYDQGRRVQLRHHRARNDFWTQPTVAGSGTKLGAMDPPYSVGFQNALVHPGPKACERIERQGTDVGDGCGSGAPLHARGPFRAAKHC